VGETPLLFPALWGLWFYYTYTPGGQIRATRDLAEQLVSLAQRAQDPALLVAAHRALGSTYMVAGQWASALAQWEQGIALYDPQKHRSLAFLYDGHDPGVCCLSWSAASLWLLGYPDQGLRRGQEALTLARQMSQPTSLAYALLAIGDLNVLRRDAAATLELAEALLQLSAKHGLPSYRASASVQRGWALAQLGHAEEGIAQIHDGLAASAFPLLFRPFFLILLAEAYGKAGKFEEALAALAEAPKVVEGTTVAYHEPPLYRVKGELLLARTPPNLSEAEACFRRSIDIARRESLKSLELQAVLSLSRLYHQQSKEDEVRPMLAEVYGWFTEGFGTLDLQEAKALLEVIS
jgi:predicted ATPase